MKKRLLTLEEVTEHIIRLLMRYDQPSILTRDTQYSMIGTRLYNYCLADIRDDFGLSRFNLHSYYPGPGLGTHEDEFMAKYAERPETLGCYCERIHELVRIRHEQDKDLLDLDDLNEFDPLLGSFIQKSLDEEKNGYGHFCRLEEQIEERLAAIELSTTDVLVNHGYHEGRPLNIALKEIHFGYQFADQFDM